MKILVVGLGAIGGLITALLIRKNLDVKCLVKSSSLGKYFNRTLYLDSQYYGQLQVSPNVISEADEEFDLIIISLKSYGLKESLEKFRLGVGSNTIILSLLNGLGNREILQSLLKGKILIGTIGHIECYQSNENKIIHSNVNPPRIEIGITDGFSHSKIEEISNLLQEIGIKAETLPNENEVVWRKLVRLATLSAVGAATNQCLGEILIMEESAILFRNVLREMIDLAKANSVILSFDEVYNQISKFDPNLITSFHRDLLVSKESEIHSIIELPLILGEKLGVKMNSLNQCYLQIISKYSFREEKIKLL
ncbi:ketopantoate reductase family protein [Leptospira jelokensis]|uniref:ketopantoate reductase family protein n=1 Tax=Leptospira jelokensis TaxID=2484931 RepID=UPI001090BC26|nr:2-dehydropantoate 2-reductase [Leptospira jelokensis]TGL99197.1 ketopantoate reductase family protein [Leptospira jelokensis]